MLSSFHGDKVTLYERLARFIRFLAAKPEGFKQTDSVIFGEIEPSAATERKIKLLKLLQGDKAESMNDLENRFIVNKKHLQEDLDDIERGIRFLGQEMKLKITKKMGKSSIFPPSIRYFFRSICSKPIL